MKKLFNNRGIKTLVITIIINTLLFVLKLLAGIIANSNAMVSDSIHSLSDVITTIIVIIGLILSKKAADAHHQYGHERIENIFAIVLSFILLITGCGIGIMGIENIIKSTSGEIYTPGLFALISAVISIVVKELMFHYTMAVAKIEGSTSMEADAWHHRSDALSSIGSLIGIAGSRMGFQVLDPICSLIICIIIVKSAIEIFINAIKGLLDVSCDENLRNEIIDIIEDFEEVKSISELKTRMFGNKVYIDADIFLDGDKTLKEANSVAVKMHDTIEDKLHIVKHCNIHVLPE